MRTTAYLKAIMEVYGKTILGLGPTGASSNCFLLAFIYVVSLQVLTLMADKVTISKIGIRNITLCFIC